MWTTCQADLKPFAGTTRQNIVLSFAASDGMVCSTSQCSTILPLVVEAEDVDAGPVRLAGPLLVAVEDDVAPLGDRPLHVHALAGMLARHPLEELDERLLAVGDAGVVLDVDVPDVPAGRPPPACPG